MKNKLHSLFPAIAVLIASLASAGADTKNYSWNGSSAILPPLYTLDPGKYATYAIESSRLHVVSPGANGWVGNQFDWDGSLADNEQVSGSMTFRINSFNNGGSLGRVRLFWFNAPFANGLNAFVGLYGTDKKTTRNSDGGWKPGGHSEWNIWEYNPSDAGAAAPAGKTYVYNSMNMNDPVTDPNFFMALDNGTEHVLSWSAQYVAGSDLVKVTTALDGVPWTTTCVGRQYNNLGWGENALAKQHGSMQGPWNAKFRQVYWVTTTVPTPASDTKNYSWAGKSEKLPPLYTLDAGKYTTYVIEGSDIKRLHVVSPGGNGWVGNQFDWNGPLANNEKVSGSVTFRIDSYDNGGGVGRVRLFWFNAPFANGLNAFMSLYGSDKKLINTSGWYAGGHSEWNKWEFNPSDAPGGCGEAAPAGKTYVYNSFNMNNPDTDASFFKLLDNGTEYVLSWSAQYIASDVVRVTTALDGVAWTTTDVNRNYNNLGWGENALAKQHGSMQGPWDAQYRQVFWVTTPDAVPSIAITPTGGENALVTWPLGNLYDATDLNGSWTLVPGTSPKAITMSPPAVAPIRFFKAQY